MGEENEAITINQRVEIVLHEWQFLALLAAISSVAAVALAIRDRQYDGILHLVAIGLVAAFVGLGVSCVVWAAIGSINTSQPWFYISAVVAGLGGRKVEQGLTNKFAKAFGLENDADSDRDDQSRRHDLGH